MEVLTVESQTDSYEVEPKILSKAVGAAGVIVGSELFGQGKRNIIGAASLVEGLIRADIFDDYSPTVITSVGGTDNEMPTAAPFNIIPALEVADILRQLNYNPTVIVSSAYKYAALCNGLDDKKTAANWRVTKSFYKRIIQTFYPVLSPIVIFEELEPAELEEYPEFLRGSAAQISKANESLRATADKNNAGLEGYTTYMLSHIQAFRDYQPEPENRFVVKVGPQSE